MPSIAKIPAPWLPLVVAAEVQVEEAVQVEEVAVACS
jgi:hypothetical protein